MTTTIRIREATAADEDTLWLMLTFAASMGSGGTEQVPQAQADVYLRTYVEKWSQRAGDLGVVALDRDERSVGAAWLRLNDGFGDFTVGTETVPELAMGVLPGCREGGIGTLLMNSLISIAKPRFDAIALSVRETNRAAHFYERFGFRETGRLQNRVGGASLILRLDLQSLGPLPNLDCQAEEV